MNALICPGWVFTFPVVLFVCNQFFFCYVYCCVVWWWGWKLSVRRNCCYLVVHEIVPFQASVPGIISVCNLGVERASSIWVQYWWSYLCAIWDDVGFHLWWFPFCAPWVHFVFVLFFTLWHGASSVGPGVVCYCVLALFCAVLGVCFSLGSFAGGVDVSCGTAMLNIFSAAVWFSTSCGMGMDGAEYWRSFVSSSATCVTSSSGDRLGNLFCSGKSSVMLETRSNSF